MEMVLLLIVLLVRFDLSFLIFSFSSSFLLLSLERDLIFFARPLSFLVSGWCEIFVISDLSCCFLCVVGLLSSEYGESTRF